MHVLYKYKLFFNEVDSIVYEHISDPVMANEAFIKFIFSSFLFA
ncbi:hypothetical protein PPRY_b0456 [Pseudoalteromonas prydzensis ACAM 620]|nr:hypothetical protein [Pseudoalteromonas prydzensis ACAM 620]